MSLDVGSRWKGEVSVVENEMSLLGNILSMASKPHSPRLTSSRSGLALST